MGKKSFTTYILIALLFGIVPQGSTNSISPQVVPTELTLGGLFPLTGTLLGGGVEREAAFRMAIEQINADTAILPDTILKYLVRDTATNPVTGATAAQELLDLGVYGFVGAASSAVSRAVADVVEVAGKPQISYSSTFADLSNKTEYPYFMRVVPPDSVQGSALAHILWDLNVRDVATLSTADDYGRGTINSFNQTFLALGGSIKTSQEFPNGAADVTVQLQAIKDSSTTVIVANMVVGDAKTVFSQAATLGITFENGYQWVGSDGLTQDQVYDGDAIIHGAMEGMVGTVPNRGEGPLFEAFLDLWESCNGQKSAEYTGCGDRTPNNFAAYAYDAVYAFALSTDALIKAGEDPNNGTLLLEELKVSQFDGITGFVSFDENHDRNGLYDLLNHDGTLFVDVGDWDSNSGLSLTAMLHHVFPSYYQIPIELRLGGLFSLSGTLAGGGVEREAAFRMAIDQINDDPTILPDTILTSIVRDTQTDPTAGADAAQELLSLDVFGLVGAAASRVSIAIAEHARLAKTPQISYSSTNSVLSDKFLYPYFLRVLPSEAEEGIALANILWDLNITNVGIIYETSIFLFRDHVTAFENAFTNLGGTITTSQPLTAGDLDMTSQLSAIKATGTKTILVNTFNNEAVEIFLQAENFDMTINEDYQWVSFSPNAHNYDDAGIMERIQGMIGVSPNTGEGPLFEAFLDLWESCNGQTSAEYAECGDRTPNRYATFAYDAVYAFALAADALINSELDPTDGDVLLQELQKANFDGATGRIRFDENGDRITFTNIMNHNGTGFVDIGDWSEDGGTVLTQPVSWSSEFFYLRPNVTTPPTSITSVVTSSTLTTADRTSSEESQQSPTVNLPYNIFWGIVGMFVVFRMGIHSRKLKPTT